MKETLAVMVGGGMGAFLFGFIGMSIGYRTNFSIGGFVLSLVIGVFLILGMGLLIGNLLIAL